MLISGYYNNNQDSHIQTLHLIIARIVTPFICGAVVAPNWARLLGRRILRLLSCQQRELGSRILVEDKPGSGFCCT